MELALLRQPGSPSTPVADGSVLLAVATSGLIPSATVAVLEWRGLWAPPAICLFHLLLEGVKLSFDFYTFSKQDGRNELIVAADGNAAPIPGGRSPSRRPRHWLHTCPASREANYFLSPLRGG